MAITRASILWYWDARYGLGPLVGQNAPTFHRTTAQTAYRPDGGTFSMPAHKPRYRYLDVGNEYRAALEIAASDERIEWATPPGPQAMAGYFKYRFTAWAATHPLFMLLDAGSTNTPRLEVQHGYNNSADFYISLFNGTAQSLAVPAFGGAPSVGDILEVYWELQSNGTVNGCGRRNGGTRFAGNGNTPAGGLPARWGTTGGTRLCLGQINGLAASTHWWFESKIVTLSSLASASLQDRLVELAALELDPFGRLIS